MAETFKPFGESPNQREKPRDDFIQIRRQLETQPREEVVGEHLKGEFLDGVQLDPEDRRNLVRYLSSKTQVLSNKDISEDWAILAFLDPTRRRDAIGYIVGSVTGNFARQDEKLAYLKSLGVTPEHISATITVKVDMWLEIFRANQSDTSVLQQIVSSVQLAKRIKNDALASQICNKLSFLGADIRGNDIIRGYLQNAQINADIYRLYGANVLDKSQGFTGLRMFEATLDKPVKFNGVLYPANQRLVVLFQSWAKQEVIPLKPGEDFRKVGNKRYEELRNEILGQNRALTS